MNAFDSELDRQLVEEHEKIAAGYDRLAELHRAYATRSARGPRVPMPDNWEDRVVVLSTLTTTAQLVTYGDLSVAAGRRHTGGNAIDVGKIIREREDFVAPWRVVRAHQKKVRGVITGYWFDVSPDWRDARGHGPNWAQVELMKEGVPVRRMGGNGGVSLNTRGRIDDEEYRLSLSELRERSGWGEL